ncbi:hypothetical protein E2I00_004056 [Balaenoptera physalus]|uniref:Fatty acid hydroxylase domain-containing protein n=1 Tax=Balaenoptera physalus TaxID=9770 RepID=A0A643BWS0_BALPH|nr:hypothetical protein E2I00_004056 [Balaenoptera physalus]
MSSRNGSELHVLCSSGQLFLQPLWDRLRTWEALIQSPFFPVVFSITTYVGFCLPFVVLDVLCPWNSSPFALATQYMSVGELLSLGFFDMMNVLLLQCHPLTVLTFHVVNIWLSVEDHSGYDFPWSTHKLVPFGWYGGVEHHDLHHSQFTCNFAPYFTHWDRILGTLRSAHSK